VWVCVWVCVCGCVCVGVSVCVCLCVCVCACLCVGVCVCVEVVLSTQVWLRCLSSSISASENSARIFTFSRMTMRRNSASGAGACS